MTQKFDPIFPNIYVMIQQQQSGIVVYLFWLGILLNGKIIEWENLARIWIIISLNTCSFIVSALKLAIFGRPEIRNVNLYGCFMDLTFKIKNT